MKPYNYPKSREAYNRACHVIPGGIYGHLGPAEGCMIPIDAYPFFISHAKGTHIWDIDGNKFIDYMSAYGANILGYCDQDVDSAFKEQMTRANCTSLPSTNMIDLAEFLVETVKTAKWAYFMKNGNDATTFAIMIARHATQKKKIVFLNGFYHGVAPWCQKKDSAGVIEEDVINNLYIPFNDFNALEQVFEENKNQLACFIGTPYLHGNFLTNILPVKGYWQRVRQLCSEHNVILIIDDVRCGFRLDLAGSDHYYGFEADLICFGKAIANGYSISALCGKEFLKTKANEIMYTGSYWMSAAPFAAALETLKKLKKLDTPKYLREFGLKLTSGMQKIAQENGFNLEISGEPSLFYAMVINDDSQLLNQEWISECVRRGVFFTSHHNHFINMAMNNEDLEYTFEVTDEAFKEVRKKCIK
jgi:glutamate-1-semialdehyde 2,1-aminomutase